MILNERDLNTICAIYNLEKKKEPIEDIDIKILKGITENLSEKNSVETKEIVKKVYSITTVRSKEYTDIKRCLKKMKNYDIVKEIKKNSYVLNPFVKIKKVNISGKVCSGILIESDKNWQIIGI